MISKIIPLVLVIAAVALFLGYIQPTYTGSIATFSAENTSLDVALKAAQEFKEKEVALTRERSTIPADQLARLESSLPDSVDNVQLIVDLNSLAARSGVQLSQFNISGGETTGGDTAVAAADAALTNGESTDSLEISVSATGTYVQDSATGVYTYDMTFRLYWLR